MVWADGRLDEAVGPGDAQTVDGAGQPQGGQDEAGDPELAPPRRAGRTVTAKSQARRAAPTAARKAAGPTTAAQVPATAARPTISPAGILGPGRRKDTPEDDGQHDEHGDQKDEQAELEGQPREVEVPAEKRQVGVFDDPTDGLINGDDGAGGKGRGGDVSDDGRQDGWAGGEFPSRPGEQDGQAHGEPQGRQGRQEDVGRGLGQAFPGSEAGHVRPEQAERLDPFEMAQRESEEPQPDEQGRARDPGEGVAAAEEPGRGPEEGEGGGAGDNEGEDQDEAQALPRRREPRGQGRRGQGDGRHDAPGLVPEREEERLDLVLLPGLADELVLVAGEELLEALDIRPEIPVVDVEFGPAGPGARRGTHG